MKTFTSARHITHPAHGLARRAAPTKARAARQPPQIRSILHAPRLQAKLKVGAANDPLEREADRVADAVMRMPDPGPVGAELQPSANTAPSSAAPPTLRRLCTECEDQLQRKENRAIGAAPDAAPGIVHEVLRGPGRPLDVATRAFFEPRFGRDLSDVRVHSDARAGKSAESMGAMAYTLGNDVVFGRGAYAPRNAIGRRLLAHELAHVGQQGGARNRLQRQLAPAPDFVEIARRVHNAMAGLGTDEAALFAALRELGRDQQAGDELKRVYQNIHGEDLETDLREDLNADEMAVARRLLDPGNSITPLTAARRAVLEAGVHSIARTGDRSANLYQEPSSGKLSGYQLEQQFTARFDPTANPSDYAIIQWIKGEMYETRGNDRVYWPASMGLYGRGSGQPWRFIDWVIDTPDADPRFGSDRGVTITVPDTVFGDAPGVMLGQGALPAGHHWEVDARVGIYPWGPGIPTYVAGWESVRPSPLVETEWGWTVEVRPNQAELDISVR